jgi:Cu/Zn superoxide dismutase
MKKVAFPTALVAAVLLAIGAASYAAAGSGSNKFEADLTGYQETPATLSSPGSGTFEARLDEDNEMLEFELTIAGLPTTVLAAHIHLGARATGGGVSAFLCGGGGKPACPQSGTVTGTITPANVIGPAAQGIAAGEFDELVAAMRAGATYANVHTRAFPGGEIRGQISGNNEGDDDD